VAQPAVGGPFGEPDLHDERLDQLRIAVIDAFLVAGQQLRHATVADGQVLEVAA